MARLASGCAMMEAVLVRGRLFACGTRGSQAICVGRHMRTRSAW